MQKRELTIGTFIVSLCLGACYASEPEAVTATAAISSAPTPVQAVNPEPMPALYELEASRRPSCMALYNNASVARWHQKDSCEYAGRHQEGLCEVATRVSRSARQIFDSMCREQESDP